MAWCDACSRYYTPTSLPADGTCPSCGAVITSPEEVAASNRAPWHFWLLVAAAVIYLGWRLVQGIAWVIGQL